MPITQSPKEAQQAIAANVLREGGKVLLVGGESVRQWGQWANHPRVVIWTDNELSRRSGIPSNVRLVLLTEHLSHKNAEYVVDQCNRKRVHTFRYMNRVGEVKQLLTDVLSVSTVDKKPLVTDKVPERTIEMPKTAVVKTDQKTTRPTAARGAIKNFILSKKDLNLRVPASELVTEMWDEAHARFPSTTKDSLMQTIYGLRKEAGITDYARKIVSPKMKGSKIRTTPVARKGVIKTSRRKPSVTTGSTVNLSNESDAVKLIDDAIAALQLAREAFIEGMRRHTEDTNLRTQLLDLLKGGK